MENEYYTPDIEDFRIGYEYEFHGVDKIWHKLIYNYQNLSPSTFYNIEKGFIRVPYITKEQIEAEGWEVRDDNFRDFIIFGEKENGSKILYNFEKRILDVWNEKDKNLGDLFHGECKSINEFRYICKLLKI